LSKDGVWLPLLVIFFFRSLNVISTIFIYGNTVINFIFF
jgi:hypothetical protein